MPSPLLPPSYTSTLGLFFFPFHVFFKIFISPLTSPSSWCGGEHIVYICPDPTSPSSGVPGLPSWQAPDGPIFCCGWLPGDLAFAWMNNPTTCLGAEHLESFWLWRGFGKSLVSSPSAFHLYTPVNLKGN